MANSSYRSNLTRKPPGPAQAAATAAARHMIIICDHDAAGAAARRPLSWQGRSAQGGPAVQVPDRRRRPARAAGPGAEGHRVPQSLSQAKCRTQAQAQGRVAGSDSGQ